VRDEVSAAGVVVVVVIVGQQASRRVCGSVHDFTSWVSVVAAVVRMVWMVWMVWMVRMIADELAAVSASRCKTRWTWPWGMGRPIMPVIEVRVRG